MSPLIPDVLRMAVGPVVHRFFSIGENRASPNRLRVGVAGRGVEGPKAVGEIFVASSQLGLAVVVGSWDGGGAHSSLGTCSPVLHMCDTNRSGLMRVGACARWGIFIPGDRSGSRAFLVVVGFNVVRKMGSGE